MDITVFISVFFVVEVSICKIVRSFSSDTGLSDALIHVYVCVDVNETWMLSYVCVYVCHVFTFSNECVLFHNTSY